MPNAWDLQLEVERQVDDTETFILFCEDEVNEPVYFQEFQKEKKVKINCIENQKSGYEILQMQFLFV